MIDRWHDPMQQWARDRGLEFHPDGLLPAWTRTLARGAGAGGHRAGLVIAQTDHSRSSTGGWKKYPERGHHHLCRGALPGGLEGVVAHQLHLELDSGSEGESWYAFPTTVVVARLPAGARVVQELTVHEFEWRADPPEDPALLAELRSPDLDAALAAAPRGTRLEYRYGGLCVAVRGAVTDAAALDALCRVAAAFAAGMNRACALLPALDPAAPLPAPADTPRARWITEGVQRVQWHTPPASVPEARAAYELAVADEAKGSGTRARKVLIPAAIVLSLVLAALILGIGLAFDSLVGAIAFIVVFGPFFLWRLFRGAWQAGGEVAADHTAAHAGPWGAEAFARAYAAARGMKLEDRDAFRRRFDSPVPGTPVKVLRGDGCRLVLWTDDSDLTVRRFHLIGVGSRTVAHEVDDAGRSAANLDRLAAEVCAPLADSHAPLSSR
jgi:hypothetical protein